MNKLPKKILKFNHINDADMVLTTALECTYIECASCHGMMQIISEGILYSGTVVQARHLEPAGKYYYFVHPRCREVFKTCPPVEE